LGIALESAGIRCPLGECSLAVVAKRWMPNVVGQARGLHYVGVNTETACQFTPNLGDFQGVGQTISREIQSLVWRENLCLRGKATQGRRMQ
jgi:hypothetical protein